MFRRTWGSLVRGFATVLLSLGLLWNVDVTSVHAAFSPVAVETVSPGVELHTYMFDKTRVYAIKVDLSNPYVRVDTMVGADGTLNQAQSLTGMTGRTGAVAGINGGFFQMKNHRPIGLVFNNGTLVSSPAMREDMPGFGITKNNQVVMDIFGFSGNVIAENGEVFPLFGINKPDYLLPDGVSADLNHLNLYNSLWGTKSREDISGQSGIVEVVVQNGIVTAVNLDKPGVLIPVDGYVLEGHGEAAQFLSDNFFLGSKVKTEYLVTPETDNLRGALGGNTFLLQNGQLVPFSQEIPGKHARTAVGIMPDRKTLYLASAEVDNDSLGITQQDMAQFMLSLGVERAVNLDGGGSTTLAARHLGDDKASLINHPQRDSQRSLPDAIGVFSTAPKGALAGLILKGPDVVLGGTMVQYAVKGYDVNFNPFQVDKQSINWRSEPVSAIEAGAFKPMIGGDFKFIASVNGVIGEKKVHVIGPEDLDKLNVEPAAVTVNVGDTVSFKVNVKTKSGEAYELIVADLRMDIQGEAGFLSDNIFTAERSGTGKITVHFQGLTKEIPLLVRTPGAANVQVSAENGAVVDLDESTALEFPAQAVDAPVNLEIKPGEGIIIPDYSVIKALEVNCPQSSEVSWKVPWKLKFKYNKEDEANISVDELSSGEVVGSGDSGDLLDESDIFIPAVGQTAVIDNKKFSSDGSKATVVKVLFKGISSDDWELQPSWATHSEKDNLETLSARISGLGQVAIVVEEQSTPSFIDMKGYWAENIVAEMALRGIVNGYPDGSYRPKTQITRAEFVALLYRALLWPKTENHVSFKDTIPAWAVDAVSAAVDKKVVSGYPDKTFKPSNGITRSEMAVIIDRILSLSEVTKQQKPVFSDTASIPSWALDQVNRVAAAGILLGDKDKFRPADSATRAEVAVAVSRVLNYWVNH